MWFAVMGVAAAEPAIEVLDGGVVRGVVDVDADLASVKSLLSKPVELGKITAADAKISVAPADEPNCRMVTTFSPHPIMPVTYLSRDCDTARGVTSKLVESKQLSHFAAEWKVEAKGERSVVTYDLDTKTNMPLPGFIVRRSTKKAVADALTRLEQSFAK